MNEIHKNSQFLKSICIIHIGVELSDFVVRCCLGRGGPNLENLIKTASRVYYYLFITFNWVDTWWRVSLKHPVAGVTKTPGGRGH